VVDRLVRARILEATRDTRPRQYVAKEYLNIVR